MRSCGQDGSRARRRTAASWTSGRPMIPSSGMVYGLDCWTLVFVVNFGGCCVTCTQLWRAAFSLVPIGQSGSPLMRVFDRVHPFAYPVCDVYRWDGRVVK